MPHHPHPVSAGLLRGAIAFWLLSLAPGLHARYVASAICPGDVLAVAVFEHPDLTSTAQVQEDGRIRLPLCNWVQAAGKTAGALAEELSAAYAKASIEKAFVTVQITAYGPRTVYVIGEVLEGGKSLEITPPAKLTVTQAVSAAGGFTDSADLRRVMVRREGADGAMEEIPVDVLAVISGARKAQDLALEVGDTVVIPRSLPVYVVGEVKTPGMFQVGTHSALRCSEVLGKAGGLTDTAERAQVQVFRRAEGTESTTLTVDMDAVYAGKFDADISIQPGDMVVAARRHKIYVLGEVKKPGALELEPGVSLTAVQAVTLAGGYTDYAAEAKVLLVRKGAITTLDLKDPYRQGKTINDPQVLAGDILFVQNTVW